MLWETLDKEEKKAGGGHNVINVKSNDKDSEKAVPEATQKPISLKRSPAANWTVTCDFKKEFEPELGLKDGVPLVPLHSRLKGYRFLFLFFGVDITGSDNAGKKCMLRLVRWFTMLVYWVLCIFYWIQTFLAIKYKYIEYGAALVHLVIASGLVSVLVTHGIVNSRLDKLVHLMNKLDSINAALPIKFLENKIALVAFFTSMIFVIGVAVFPLKWVAGKGIPRREEFLAKGLDDPDDFAYQFHYVSNIVLQNYLSVFVVAFGMTWDMAYLSFFIVLAKRYYMVFRNSYFVLLLSRPNKYESMTIMQEFRKHHFTICGVVEEMDEIFSPMILIWFVLFTVCMCCWIRAFDTDGFNSLATGFIVISSLVVSFVDFYSLSNGTSLINDEMNAHLDTVRTLCIREDTPSKSSMDNFQERISHLSYITCILASPVSITGWGFFSISKGFVLTVSSTILTFTLVLYGV